MTKIIPIIVTWCITTGCSNSTMDPLQEPQPATPRHVSIVTGHSGVDFAAYQDGNGPWTPLQSANGIYSFTARNLRYGVAIACIRNSNSGRSSLTGIVHYRTTNEETVINELSCMPRGMEYLYGGTLTGVPVGEVGAVWIGDREHNIRDDNTFLASIVSAFQAHSVWGLARTERGGAITRIARGPDVYGHPFSYYLDMNAGDAPASYPISLPVSSSQSEVHTEVRNGNGPSLRLRASGGSYITANQRLFLAGDTFCVDAKDYSLDRVQAEYSCHQSLGSVFVEFPDDFEIDPPVFPTGARLFPVFHVPFENSGFPSLGYELNVSMVDGQRQSLTVHVSREWLGEDESACGFPDLSSLPRYVSGLEFSHGANVMWAASRVEQNTRGFTPGHITRTATTQGSLVVP